MQSSKLTPTGQYTDRTSNLDVSTTMDVVDGRDAVELFVKLEVRRVSFANAELNLSLDPAQAVRLLENLALIAKGNGWIDNYEITKG